MGLFYLLFWYKFGSLEPKISHMIIQAQHIDIRQGSQLIIKELSFELQKGEFAYLIGKTGSGKTSLIKTLYADLAFQTGQLSVCGYQLNTIKKNQIPYFRRKIGVVFQDFQLLSDRDIEDNLAFVMQATGWKDAQKIKKKVDWALLQVGMETAARKMPFQLSGGEQQRVAIARALVNDPQVIFADEPTGNLDPVVANQMLDLFAQIHAGGTAVLMATHHYEFLKRYPQRILFLENQLLTETNAQEIEKKMGDF